MFLGIDCSTQSLSGLVVDVASRQVIFETSLNFERRFPAYQTVSGTIRGDDPLVVHSPPLMWLEALDLLFQEMKEAGVDLGNVMVISGSAQQHGSVYLNDTFSKTVAHLDVRKSLKENLQGVFARESAPIWMDASTHLECQEIRQSLGGTAALVEASGSDAFERFTGPQIRKFFKQEPKGYAHTKTIALVSSFLASILAGKIAPIDYGDGSGMNLMDIRKKEWHPKLLEATAPHLKEKLPPLAPSDHILGSVSTYFVQKYGLNPKAQAIAWTGDNPSSLIGLGIVEEGMTGISVGTSFTHFGISKTCHGDPSGVGNLFISPTGDFMPLNCFLNGALAIQKLRNQYGIDWDQFDQALISTHPGKGILLPYFEAEIIPKVLKPGVRRFDLDENDVAANCRALIEAQMLSMRLHSDWMQMKPRLIYATGGVSHHLPILQIMADVHNCPVMRSSVAKSTALGAALIAAHATLSPKRSWKEIVKGFTDPLPPRIEPNPAAAIHYNQLLPTYATYERSLRK